MSSKRNPQANKAIQVGDVELVAWVHKVFGPGAELAGKTEEIAVVRIRQGTKLEKKPGDRIRVTLEIKLNKSGRAAGLFDDETKDLVKKDDVIQVTHGGPEDQIGALFQVNEVHGWGVRAFSMLRRRYVRLENGQFERVGPAPLVTGADNLDTEPMDHHLEQGEVVHPTQLRPKKEQNTEPMPHAVSRDLPKPKAQAQPKKPASTKKEKPDA